MARPTTTGGGKFKKVGEVFEWLGKAYFPWSDPEWCSMPFFSVNRVGRIALVYIIIPCTGYFFVGLTFGTGYWKPNTVGDYANERLWLFNAGVAGNKTVRGTAVQKVDEWNESLMNNNSEKTARTQIK